MLKKKKEYQVGQSTGNGNHVQAGNLTGSTENLLCPGSMGLITYPNATFNQAFTLTTQALQAPSGIYYLTSLPLHTTLPSRVLAISRTLQKAAWSNSAQGTL